MGDVGAQEVKVGDELEYQRQTDWLGHRDPDVSGYVILAVADRSGPISDSPSFVQNGLVL